MPAPLGPHCESCWGVGEPPEHQPGCPVLRAIHYALLTADGALVPYPSRTAAEAALLAGDRIVRRIGLRPVWRTFDGTAVEPELVRPTPLTRFN